MDALKMVDLARQYEGIKNEIDNAISRVITSTNFINGKEVKVFAEHLSEYLAVGHVIPCGSGTDALQIALMALGLQPGDEVITVPFTFVAPVEVIELLHLKCKFVDVDPATFNMDVSQLESVVTERTKAIIPVHLFGQCCQMEEILAFAEKHHLYVIEDCCQAIGTDYYFANGTTQKAGTIGHIGCTSFFPSKNLGCYGDGGALFTQDDTLAEKIRTIANHGAPKRYHYSRIGVNSRLDTIQAAILDVKLQHLDSYIHARQEAAERYNRELESVPYLERPATTAYSTHTYHQYTLKVTNGTRDEITRKLELADIPYGIYYPSPLHLQPAYSHLGYKKGDFPISEMLCESVLSLPMHTELTEEQITYICATLREIAK